MPIPKSIGHRDAPLCSPPTTPETPGTHQGEPWLEQASLFARVLRMYGTKASIAEKLGLDHSTIGRWEKSLKQHKRLSQKVETALNSLSPLQKSDEALTFGFHGSIFSLPALLAINQCRTNGQRNIAVRTFSAAGPMTESLTKGDTHLAAVNTTFWKDQVLPRCTDDSLSVLVDIGEGPTYGISGRRIANGWDFQNMTIFVPQKTAFRKRLEEEFNPLEFPPSVKDILVEDAPSVFSETNWENMAFIGWPDWVDACIQATVPSDRYAIDPRLLPTTPACIGLNKIACPRAPLRHFLLSLDTTLKDLPKTVRATTKWDLGNEDANRELKQMIAYVEKHKTTLRTFTHDDSFFSLIRLWDEEIHTILNWR